MQAQEWPLGVVVMIEEHRFPGAGFMAFVTRIPQRAFVQRILMTPGATLFRGVFEFVVDVALAALDTGMAACEWIRATAAVNAFDRSFGNLFHAGHLMALDTGLKCTFLFLSARRCVWKPFLRMNIFMLMARSATRNFSDDF